MFQCPECEKQYSRQASLNRHSQNHQKSKDYSCPTCHVSYFRRDLLSRHIKMHQPASCPLAASVSSSLAANEAAQSKFLSCGSQERRRCHTACGSCRKLRTKCDGNQPCYSCIRSKGLCEYDRTLRRVSQSPCKRIRLVGEHSPDRESPESEASEKRCQQSEMQTSTQLGNLEGASCDADSVGKFLSSASQTPTVFNDQVEILQEDSSDVNLSPFPLMSNDAFVDMPMENLMNNEISDSIAWSSLHENLFLQPDYFQTLWPGWGENYFQGSAIWPGIEPIQNETARALVLMKNDQQLLLDEGYQTASCSLPSFVDVKTTSHIHDQTAQRSHGPTLGTSKEDSSGTVTSSQSKVIDDLVSQSAQIDWLCYDKGKRSAYWATFSVSISEVFDFRIQRSLDTPHCLQSFIDLYLKYVHTLWPLLSYQNFDADSLHPILYLTLVSIGAMYGGFHAAHIGTLLHNRLRKTLTAGLAFGEFEHELIWLCQARLLTQVNSLYFGQTRAFSYAQQLGGITVVQARRMNLFKEPRGNDAFSGLQSSPSERLARWLLREERRRLAFGILRAETYTSVLLNTRPLVSPEEIDLELPYADSSWRGPKLAPEIFLAIVEQERASKPRQLFSDLMRIALDRDESSVFLETSGQELLILGLQQSVWRFSHDSSVFIRLTGKAEPPIQSGHDGLDDTDSPPNSNRTISSKTETPPTQPLAIDVIQDHLGASPRVMTDLQADYDRLMSALQKWKECLNFLRNTVHLHHDRNSVLSCLLLYHLSYMRIQTPLEDMHHISYHLMEKRSVEKSVLEDVRRWANSRRAIVAVQHACIIWRLISRELQRPEATRAHFNFLAFASLHHSAVVLWTFMGACEDFTPSQQRHVVIEPLENSELVLIVNHENSEFIIASFSKIFKRTSSGGWSSFGDAALRLSTCQFPAA